MSKSLLGLIVTSVALSAFAQLVLKWGMSQTEIQSSLGSAPAARILVTVFSSWRVLSGLFVYFLSAAVWLLVLSKVEVSLAYPFVGLGFVITMLLGWFFRGESLSFEKIAATMLIIAGVVILARGQG